MQQAIIRVQKYYLQLTDKSPIELMLGHAKGSHGQTNDEVKAKLFYLCIIN